MKTPRNGFATLLRTALGRQWQHLHPDIRARFTPAPGVTRQCFTGSMSTIDRSFVGWIIARTIAFVRILPPVRARDVPFEFNLAPVPPLLRGGSRNGSITLTTAVLNFVRS